MNPTDLELLKACRRCASIREMMDATGIHSTSAVSYRLYLLAAAGLIIQQKGKARIRDLTDAGHAALNDPDSVTVGKAHRPRRAGTTGKPYADWEQALVREMRGTGSTYAAIAGAIRQRGGERTMQSVHSFCTRNGIK